MKLIALMPFFLLLLGCSGMDYKRTVDRVEIDEFMGKWYVIAGRFTFMEKGAHNAVEEYSWNDKKQRIDINFYFNKDSFDGPIKKIPQKGWIENKETNATWKVSPFWPLKFDYLVVANDPDYQWTAIGVPSGKYLWIMARKDQMSDAELSVILDELRSVGYPTKEVVRIPQKWDK
jgi:apolipoprotein D and lipocalin family protein